MVKSRAEIQREYRQRLKEDPQKYYLYLAKARNRKQKSYVPTMKLSKREKAKRNEKNKQYVKKHRQKMYTARIVEQEQEVMPEKSGYETGNQSSEATPMIVNFNFPNLRNGPRKRVSRALSKTSKELKELKSSYDSLQMKYKRNLRSLQRLRKKSDANSRSTIGLQEHCDSSKSNEHIDQKQNKNGDEIEPMIYEKEATKVDTPNTKMNKLMNEANLSARRKSTFRKQLLFGYVMQSQIKKQRQGLRPNQSGCLKRLVGGTILRKYRLQRLLSKESGIGRNRVNSMKYGKVTRNREVEKNRSKVLTFLQRDDNSRANPGKRDKLKSNGETHQTRTLTDYLKNLHKKFLSANQGIKLSLASFCRIRPTYIQPTAFITRSSCLCTRHQNIALCAKALKNIGLNVNQNPETFATDGISTFENEMPEIIKFGQWKRVGVEENGRKKMVMKIVEQELKSDEFLKFIREQVHEFKEHVYRVKRQYSEIGTLKKNLKVDDAIVHMDFSENYSCKNVEEIQSAYWTQTGVTLHPIVVYFKSNEELKHKSFVVVSDELGHNSAAVISFLEIIIPKVKELVPRLNRIHYWTDSPTSQYRNKTIFNHISKHKSLLMCLPSGIISRAGTAKARVMALAVSPNEWPMKQ